MNLQWILASLLAVALISGAVSSLFRSMLKNSLRLGALVVAFLIAFILQLCGVFQGLVNTLCEAINLASLLPEEISVLGDVVPALISTVVSSLLFCVAFFILFWIFCVVIHFVLKAIEKKNVRRAEELSAAVSEVAAPQEEENEPESTETVHEETDAEPAETPEPETAPEPEKTKKAKKKKNPIYPECAWQRAISVSASIVCSLLILAILLMPISYTMGLVAEATHSIDGSDSEDSQVHEVIEVLDDYLVTPYEDSFVTGFYRVFGITSLTDYAIKAGGKVTLESGETVYADDSLREILSSGLLAISQMTSETSECEDVERSVNALLSDPIVGSVAADLLMGVFADMELQEGEEDDLTVELVNTFIEHYKNADKATVQLDLGSLGRAVGILAQKKVIYNAMNGNSSDLSSLLEDRETLAGVVSGISGLSAFAPTIEGAFKLGVGMLGDTLEIPRDDAAAYDILMNNLLEALNGESASAVRSRTFSYSKLEDFILHCAENGKKITNSVNKSHEGYESFISYLDYWRAIRSALGYSSEDRSYGYFTVNIDGKLYMYDTSDRKIYEVPDAQSAEYKDRFEKRISPLEDLVRCIALGSTSNMTESKLIALLTQYTQNGENEQCVAVAHRLISKSDFVTRATTVDGMLAATDFSNWTDEEKKKDSDLCVDIILNLLDMMDSLGESGEMGMDDIDAMVNQFVTLGKTMDLMRETSCISELPSLLLEGLVCNEMFSQYLPPYVAYEFNALVASGELTYTEAMNDLAATVRTLINGFGGAIND